MSTDDSNPPMPPRRAPTEATRRERTPPTPVQGVPIALQGDTAIERLSFMAGALEEYKKNTPTFRELREEVNGAASRLSGEIKALPSKERVDELAAKVRASSPPSAWKLVTGIGGAAVSVIGIVITLVWSVSGRISDMAVESAIRKMQLDAATADVKRVEAELQDVQRKLDQLLLRGAKP